MAFTETSQKNKRSVPSIISLEQGKIPPHATDLEQSVLGGMMIDKSALDKVIDILSPDIFYKTEHQYIFEAIFSLFANSQPVDILTVSNQLKKTEKLELAGGDAYLILLSQKVSSAAHIEHHSRVVQEKYILRKLIEISTGIIEDSYDATTDVFELLDKAENKLFEITNGTLKRSFDSSEHLVSQALEKIKSLADQEGVSGVPTGFRDIDKLTSGFQNSDLVIIAARPGMGKTAFILSMARNIAVDFNMPIAIFSLEMSAVQLIMRLISSETDISSEKLRKANLSEAEWKQLFSKVKKLEDAPLFIDDTPALSVFDLRAKCRRLVSQHKVKMIVVDYLQLMTTGGNSGNREQEISTISRSLKAIAKELDIPVIALSQLSRAVETRGGTKRPQLSDLRESGAIEQDADIVSFIYRPEYYQQEFWDDEDQSPCQGEAEVIIAKHRNGALDNVRLKFINQQAKFMDLDLQYGGGNYQVESNLNKTNDDTYESSLNVPKFNPQDSFDIPEKGPQFDIEEDDDLDF